MIASSVKGSLNHVRKWAVADVMQKGRCLDHLGVLVQVVIDFGTGVPAVKALQNPLREVVHSERMRKPAVFRTVESKPTHSQLTNSPKPLELWCIDQVQYELIALINAN